MKKKEFYKYITWDKQEYMSKIMQELEKWHERGWELVSYSQDIYGMSAILKRFSKH